MSGNEACAEGALAAGVRFFAGYPITPSSEIAEIMSRRLPQLGGVFIQMEDEIASLGAVIGASLTGLKTMDATSGPGFSLKMENLGLAIMLEAPCLIVNVQRVGPSTGMATFPAQGDVLMTRWGTHGDHPIIALAPSSVAECFHLTVKAVNLAERFRTPVILLSDALLASLREKVSLPTDVERVERKRAVAPPESYRPYAPDDTGVPPFVPYGAGYRWYASSSLHDEDGHEATSDTQVAHGLIQRLHGKIYDHLSEIVLAQEESMADAHIAILAYGSVARSARGAVRMAREKEIKAGLLRPITLWPFPADMVRRWADQVEAIIVPEMNTGQMVEKVREAGGGRTQVLSLPRWDGRLIPPEDILEKIEEVARG
ncbi:MAG: 2-oxoacid:acceptor oxidoreductase subunit alpha [Chloroflexi bacterium]|nr:2-oxoacid:acceptor oxidoreductase subunit alpha [Chloroflexota bacterium]